MPRKKNHQLSHDRKLLSVQYNEDQQNHWMETHVLEMLSVETPGGTTKEDWCHVLVVRRILRVDDGATCSVFRGLVLQRPRLLSTKQREKREGSRFNTPGSGFVGISLSREIINKIGFNIIFLFAHYSHASPSCSVLTRDTSSRECHARTLKASC